ncbi:limonene-1,2-epoxide hydrolase family protein [Rhizorhabdus sp.]|jgi:limonene-1,2-epoxide hydrolase|nr:limonene-1,2-epoxide hydrolase family protein [Rhizorhabdus sp.]MBD3761398.1 nuclear transport factor 2 family protein [Rhizorhabdus sp.]
MASPGETVTAFLAQCGNGKNEMMDAFRTYFTADTIWELVGSITTKGIDEALAKVQSAQTEYGMDHLVSEVRALATQGQSVLTERIDHVRKADGTNIDSCPCMGIFEVEAGKITAWREYYDTATHGT